MPVFIEQIFFYFFIAIAVLFFVYFIWQLRFLIVAVKKNFIEPKAKYNSKYCFVICAKNEESVIAQAIESIKAQNYPQRLYDILVVAHNCTDKTVEVCRAHGVKNILLKNDNRVGKGYALDFAFKFLLSKKAASADSKQSNHLKISNIDYDAVVVLDADNVINEDFITHMNNLYTNGHEIIAPFRNSKSFSSSITEATNALWFLRDAVLNNRGHFLSGYQCTVSGTGFLISKNIIEKLGGYPFYTILEDFEFSAYACYKNMKISFNNDAVVYDFATVTSFAFDKQHTRWLSGFVDVIYKTTTNILRGILNGATRKYCIDYSLRIFVIALLILVQIFMLFFSAVCSIALPNIATSIWISELWFVLFSLAILLLILYVFVLITVIDNWNIINASTFKKIISVICYPFCQVLNIPLFVKSIFSKRRWIHSERKQFR